jgi:hypothetical protein
MTRGVLTWSTSMMPPWHSPDEQLPTHEHGSLFTEDDLPGARVDPAGLDPLRQAPFLAEPGGDTVFRDVVDRGGKILGSGILVSPSYHLAIREQHRPLPQGLGPACLAAYQVRVVLAPCIMPSIALVPSAPLECGAGGVSPGRAHHLPAHPGTDHPGGHRRMDAWRPLRVRCHEVLPAALLLAVIPPGERGTPDQQEEQQTSLKTCHHTRSGHGASAPADREAHATQDGNRPLAP